MNGWSKEDLEEMCGDDIIEQLAFLSGCHQHQLCNSNPSGWIISDEVLRGFAALIVKECIDVMSQTAQEANKNFTYLGDDVPTVVHQMKIKQHFEVKE